MSETATEHKVDRTGWLKGQWDNEPDKLLWKHEGFDCMIVRNSLGNLCGYVGVTESHPWFGKDYSDVDADAHGGLTYADYCQGHVCHPGPEKTYWLGFDCAHSGDLVPGMEKYGDRPPSLAGTGQGSYGTYKDVSFVKTVVNRLAEQASEAVFPKLMDSKEEK